MPPVIRPLPTPRSLRVMIYTTWDHLCKKRREMTQREPFLPARRRPGMAYRSSLRKENAPDICKHILPTEPWYLRAPTRYASRTFRPNAHRPGRFWSLHNWSESVEPTYASRKPARRHIHSGARRSHRGGSGRFCNLCFLCGQPVILPSHILGHRNAGLSQQFLLIPQARHAGPFYHETPPDLRSPD